ncbi:MAG: hypothetical protein ACREUG_09095, partial [Steroidobacteraceae bacterium]
MQTSAPGEHPLTFGNTLLGEGELAAGGIANMPHAALHAGVDLYRRLTGGNTEAPDPGFVQATAVPVGEAARNLVRGVSELPPAQAISHGAHVADVALGNVSPTLQDVVHQALDVGGDVLNIAPAVGVAARGASGIADALSEAGGTAEEGAPNMVQVARAAGYGLNPAHADGSTVAKAAEGLTGSAKLRTSLSATNQANTNRLAAEEIGIDPTKPITDQALNKAKQPFNAAYEQAASLGPLQVDQQFRDDIGGIGGDRISTDPAVEQLKSTYGALQGVDADQLVNEVRGLRRDANQNIKAPYDPERQAKGYAQQQAADAFDDLLERNAIAQGQPQIVDQLKAARVGLAKINTVQQALTGNDVSALALAKMADRGAPLSGRLKIISDVATHFPKVMRDAASLTDRTSFTVPELAFGGGEAIGSLAAGHPLQALGGAALIAARHGVRALLESPLYQNRLGTVATELGPDSALGEYFARPGVTAPEAAVPAPQLGAGAVPFEETPPTIGGVGPQ